MSYVSPMKVDSMYIYGDAPVEVVPEGTRALYLDNAGRVTVSDSTSTVCTTVNAITDRLHFVSKNDHYKYTKSTTWEVIGQFYFMGTDRMGLPSSMKAIVWVQQASSYGDVRIYDPATNTTLADSTAFNNTIPTVVNLTDQTSWPTSATLVEVQLRRNSGGNKKIYISEVLIDYVN